MQPGWYPDPTQRFEFRYFNGVTWTADVADDGTRRVDALGTVPTPSIPAFPPAAAGGNGLATAAMVVGIVAACLGALLVLFWVAAPMGIVAFVLGLVALGRSRRTGIGRPQALTGIIAGPIAVVLSIVGVVVLWPDLRDAFRDATRRMEGTSTTVDISGCELIDGSVKAVGTITNNTSIAHTFRIEIEVLPKGSSDSLVVVTDRVEGVGPGETRSFEASGDAARVATDVRCSLQRVTTD